MKMNKSISIIGKIYKHIFAITPISGIFSLVYFVIDGLFPAFITIFSAKLFDSVMQQINGQGNMNQIYVWGAFLLIGYGVKELFLFVAVITINAGVYEKVKSITNIKLHEKSAKLNLLDYENSEIIDCKNRAMDCSNREMLSHVYRSSAIFIVSAISVISVISILVDYSIYFLPICILSILPYFIARLIRGNEFYTMKRAQVKNVRRRDYLWSILTDRKTIKEMRIMGFGDYISHKWMSYRDEINEELWEHGKKDGKSLLFCDSIRIIGYSLCLILAIFLAQKNIITIGMLAACITAFASVQQQTKSFLIEFGKLPERINYAKDYYEFLALPEDSDGDTILDEIIDSIHVDGIEFKYPNNQKPVVKNVSMKINKGETIAILGENGSGKTTLSKLILGLYPVQNGNIYYNNTPISSLKKSSLFNKVSIVTQDYTSYQLSLRENVAISCIAELNNDLKIVNALEKVGIAINENNFSLDSQLGRDFGSIDLSGGQWQKIAIARGMFRDSQIIVLDEPTSSLDPIVEFEILHDFINAVTGKTAIIISHRVGLCKMVDKVAVMKDGELVEFGCHDELIQMEGEYARLYNAQKQWYV